MGFFPTDANDQDEIGPNTNGTYFKYIAGDNKWIIIGGVTVYSEAEVDALDHDHFPNPNGNAEEQHLTSTQQGNLHVATVAGDLNHNDLDNIDADDVKHISATQLGDLHTIYTLESHDNTDHSTNYEVANANIQSHVASPVTDAHHTLYTLEEHDNDEHNPDFCVDDDARLSDDRTPITHAMSTHTDEGDHVTHNYGNGASTVCQGNDGRLADARTPTSHDNTYHSTNYEPEFSSNNWKVYATNGSAVMTEITIGDSNTVLTSNGTEAAPTFTEPGAGADANAVHINAANEITGITPKTTIADADEFIMEDSAASFVKKAITGANFKTAIQNHAPASHALSAHSAAAATLDVNGQLLDNVSHIQSDGTIYLAPGNDVDDELVIATVGGSLRMYQEGATDSNESGVIGFGTGASRAPFFGMYANGMFDDDGNLGSYSQVDDFQLLREMTEYGIEKPLSPDFPDTKQKIWDMNTLPWIKAHQDVNALAIDSNTKRYSLSLGARDGFVISALKKIVEKLDSLETRILELEK